MSRRFQFSLKWLFVATLVVAAFFAGRHFEHRQRMVDREYYAASLELLEAENASLRKHQSNPFIGSRLRIDPNPVPRWQIEHAQAVETRGFQGATPASK